MSTERDILHLTASLPAQASDASDRVRSILTGWAVRTVGRSLPPEAARGETFDDPSVGRSVAAERIVRDDLDLWSLRVEVPDSDVAGRVWTTEASIGCRTDRAPSFALRLGATGTVWDDIAPAVPKLVREIGGEVGLHRHERRLAETIPISGPGGANRLCELIERPDRRLPVVLFTGPGRYPFEPRPLGRALYGLAHVATLDDGRRPCAPRSIRQGDVGLRRSGPPVSDRFRYCG